MYDNLETPCYLIDFEELEYNYDSFNSSFSNAWEGEVLIGYSVKTNPFPWILEYMKGKGAFAEVVSEDEYNLALELGYTHDRIILNGPYKPKELLNAAILGGAIVNIETFSQLENLRHLAKNHEVNVGLRVNFDLENECPNESAMGLEPGRFGFGVENNNFLKALKLCGKLNINVIGLHMHQSSKTRSLAIYRSLATKVAECINSNDLVSTLKYIDIGGGFFGGRHCNNKPTFEQYAKTIKCILSKTVNMNNINLVLEPGASLIATPISYLTRVVDINMIRNNRFVVVDGTRLHVNPFFFNRNYCYNLPIREKKCFEKQTVCGCTCLENDRIMVLENKPILSIGDIIRINHCGSYTMSFNSDFILQPPTVYVFKEGRYESVR